MGCRRRGEPRRSFRLHQRAKPSGLRGHDHRPARGERGQGGRDQAVDVEQRHDAERHVVRVELVRPDDVADRGGQVAVSQRHALRAAGRAAGVEDQRRRVRIGHLQRPPIAMAWLLIWRRPAACSSTSISLPPAGRARRAARLTWRHEQEPGARVLEVEPELVLLVCRVERAGDADHRRGQEREDRFRPIGEDERDAITRRDTGAPSAITASSSRSRSRP